MNWLSLAIVLSAVILAGAYAVSHRYTIDCVNDAGVWRLDQWTGNHELCVVANRTMLCFKPVPTDASPAEATR
jgi:hypothetical protein